MTSLHNVMLQEHISIPVTQGRGQHGSSDLKKRCNGTNCIPVLVFTLFSLKGKFGRNDCRVLSGIFSPTNDLGHARLEESQEGRQDHEGGRRRNGQTTKRGRSRSQILLKNIRFRASFCGRVGRLTAMRILFGTAAAKGIQMANELLIVLSARFVLMAFHEHSMLFPALIFQENFHSCPFCGRSCPPDPCPANWHFGCFFCCCCCVHSLTSHPALPFLLLRRPQMTSH